MINRAIVFDVDLGAGRSSCIALMFLPPGPMSLPIFSGSILTRQQTAGPTC